MAEELSSYEKWQIELAQEHLPFDVEGWAGVLEEAELTFPTVFVEFHPQDAQAVITAYRHRFNINNASGTDGMTYEAAVGRLSEVEAQIDASLPSGWNGMFVRLSSRSPKDGMAFQASGDQILEAYQRAHEARMSALQQINDGSWDEADMEACARICALGDVTGPLLRVDSGAAALALIASSERVYTDLLRALVVWKATGEWSTRISLRKWDPRVHHTLEFRVFVHGGAVVAISQYNHYVCIPKLVSSPGILERITSDVVRIQRRVQRALGPDLDTYILDIAIFDDEFDGVNDHAGGIVIELNPYRTTTGAALFDWRHDASILYPDPDPRSEEKDIPFRIHRQPVPELVHLADAMQHEFLDLVRTSAPTPPSSHPSEPSEPSESSCHIL